MPATNIPLVIEQEATLNFTFFYEQPNDQPVDLSGYTARLQIRPSAESGAVLADWTTENGHIVLGGKAGTITLAATADETAALSWDGWARYDLELSINGNTRRLAQGAAILSKGVTR